MLLIMLLRDISQASRVVSNAKAKQAAVGHRQAAWKRTSHALRAGGRVKAEGSRCNRGEAAAVEDKRGVAEAVARLKLIVTSKAAADNHQVSTAREKSITEPELFDEYSRQYQKDCWERDFGIGWLVWCKLNPGQAITSKAKLTRQQMLTVMQMVMARSTRKSFHILQDVRWVVLSQRCWTKWTRKSRLTKSHCPILWKLTRHTKVLFEVAQASTTTKTGMMPRLF